MAAKMFPAVARMQVPKRQGVGATVLALLVVAVATASLLGSVSLSFAPSLIGASNPRGIDVSAPAVVAPNAALASTGTAHAAMSTSALAATLLGAAACAALVVERRRSSQAPARRRFATQLCAEGEEKTKLSDINVGDKFDAVVKRVANIGIWVDIGAEKQALWPKVQLPADASKYKVGDTIEGMRVFEVQDGDTPSERKIRVSLKTLTAELKAGDKLEGTVKRVMDFGVFFDVGTAKDALAPSRLLDKSKEEYTAGDKVPLTVVNVDGGKLTVRTGTGEATAPRGAPVSTLKVGDEVKGTVAKVEEFGLFVNIGAQRDALCRAAQLPKEVKEYSQGEDVPGLKVLSVDAEKGLVEVTPRMLSSEVKEGDKLEGTVKEVNSQFGVFFDAGLAVDVLCPGRMLSKPSEEYTKGEVADLVVTRVDGQRVTVSTKSEEEMGIPLYKLVRGMEVTGKVVRSTPGIGLFVDIGASEAALLRERALSKPIGEYAEGDEIEGLIIVKVDASEGNVEVTSKDAPAMEQGTPLADLQPGQTVDGTVTRAAPFGVFVNIGAERDALWPVDQLPKSADEYKPGDEVAGLTIVQVDPSKARLTVSTKRAAGSYAIGEEVSGVVKKVVAFGVFLDIGASTQALAPSRLLEKEPGEYSVGEELTGLKVEQVNEAQNQISVAQLDRPKDKDNGLDAVSIGDLEIGKQIKGIVRRAQDYGVFVDIGMGRKDALMPAALMGGQATTDFKPNDPVEVYIAQVDVATERVTLSMEEPPEGGVVQRSGRSSMPTDGYIPNGDMAPDREYWKALIKDDELALWDEPVPWKEWETKYPGMVKHAEKETELYLCTRGGGFSGIAEAQPAGVAYIPIPVHLRRADAEPPEIPPVDFDDYKMGYHYGDIDPKIFVKYRTPPLNDPNWTFDHRMDPRMVK